MSDETTTNHIIQPPNEPNVPHDSQSTSGKYRPPPAHHGFQPFDLNMPSEVSPAMSAATQNQNKTRHNAPLEQYKDGAVTIKLYEKSYGDKTYVNASVGKLYKDKDSGEWRESRSFSPHDLLKLQALMPQAREGIQKWQEYFREQQQSQSQENSPQFSNAKHHGIDMRAQRDAVMRKVQQQQDKPSPERENDPTRSR